MRKHARRKELLIIVGCATLLAGALVVVSVVLWKWLA